MLNFTRKTLRLWSWVYRTTGWFFPPVRLVCWQDIGYGLDKIGWEDLKDQELSVGNAVDLKIGAWEARSGFCR